MKVIFLLLVPCFSAQVANCKLQRCPKGCWCRCRTQTDRPPPPIYSGSADASSSSCALQGSGIGSMRKIFSVHGSWEGKELWLEAAISKILGTWEVGGKIGESGSMGAWERLGRVRPRSTAGNVGSWVKAGPLQRENRVRFRCDPVIEEKVRRETSQDFMLQSNGRSIQVRPWLVSGITVEQCGTVEHPQFNALAHP